MAKVDLHPEDRDELIRILVARSEMRDQPARENFLYDCRLLSECSGKLHWDAIPDAFVRQLIRVLEEDLGSLETTGYPALESLLRGLRYEVRGHADLAAFIDRLLRPFSAEDLNDQIDVYFTDLMKTWESGLLEAYEGLTGDVTVRDVGPSGRSRSGVPIGGGVAPKVGRPGQVFARMQERLGAITGEHRQQEQSKPKRVEDVGEKLMATPRCVVLGEPGSGKTWTLQWLALRYMDDWYKADAASKSKSKIPIWVPLQSFKGRRYNLDGTESTETFAEYLRDCARPLEQHMDRLVAERRLVPICDALNEMPRREGSDPDGRELVPQVRTELGKYGSFHVSCRVRDFRDDLRNIEDLEQIRLLDLDLPRMQQAITVTFADEPARGQALWQTMGGSDELLALWEKMTAQADADRFWTWNEETVRPWDSNYAAWRRMHGGARLLLLARNPFLLRVICDIYRHDGDLPGNRAALFECFIGDLLAREAMSAMDRDPWSEHYIEQLMSGLEATAREMQSLRTTILPKDMTQSLMERAACDIAPPDKPLRDALQASILVETADGVRFSHQLLQEYFAVQVLLVAMDAAEASAHDPAQFFQDGEGWWDPGPWRETTVILGEFLADRAIGPNRVARWLAPASPEIALEVITRNGEGLTLNPDLEPETRAVLIDAAWQKSTEQDPCGRAAAWRVLSLLGADERPGVGLRADGLPDFTWSEVVEPGAVEIGDLWYDEGTAVGRRTVDSAFAIANYQVTYAQYQAFVKAPDGYNNRQWWDMPPNLAYRDDMPGDQEWRIPNHPAENVSWYDAMAFCRWVTFSLRQAGLPELQDGRVIRLPTEAEWQLAAGGPNRDDYPWGSTYAIGFANVDESGEDGGVYIEKTTAVGIYPNGKADCGALDMSGNVWEWTLSESGDGSQSDITNDGPRVLRGGSWGDYPVIARASYRVSSLPGLRLPDLGFRVVVAAPVP